MVEQKAVMEILPETNQLEALISNVSWLAKRHLAHEISAFSLTAPQYSVLRCLQQKINPQTMSQLTRECSAVMPTMTGIIKRLETRGLVTRERDKNDRRLLFISITPLGEQLIGEITRQRREQANKFFETLSNDERKFMIDLLHRYMDYMIDGLDVEPEQNE
jgi:DNA-binding MarR family transcriptional regulator